MKKNILVISIFIALLNSVPAKSESFCSDKTPNVDNLIKSTSDVLEQILELPFNQQMSNGTLSKQKFDEYIQQDKLYMFRYRQCFAYLAYRAPTTEMQWKLFNFGLDTYSEHDLTDPGVNQNMTAKEYSDYEEHIVKTGSIAEGYAALLPCAIIYCQVGKALKKDSNKVNPYLAKWINIYSSVEYECSVSKSKEFMERLMAKLSTKQKEEIGEIYRKSSLYELAFWKAILSPSKKE